MLCLKKRRTYSFTQGAHAETSKHHQQRHYLASSCKRDERGEEQNYTHEVAVAIATLPRKLIPREERSSAMVLTVTEDTPADMLAGSMELLVQMPRDHHVQTQRVTVQRSTPMMDLLVQIATAHKLAAASYTLQAIGERGLVLPHQPNTPIGALDALQVKLLPKQGTFLSRKNRQTNQPFETTFRLQVHLPRNQLYVSRVSPKTNLGEILDEVCREKNLDRNKYELRHPANLTETLDLSLTLQDYHLQEVTLYPRQPSRNGTMSSALSSRNIMDLQKQEECNRQQAQKRNSGGGVFGFMFKKSKESSLSTDSLGNRSVSPARSDETTRSSSPRQQRTRIGANTQPPVQPARPLRKRRPAPKPPTQPVLQRQESEQTTRVSRTESKSERDIGSTTSSNNTSVPDKDKIVISHSRNSSDSSGYHEASVLSDNPDNGDRMPETLPRRGRMQGILEAPRQLAHTSQASKSLGNLPMASSQGGTLSRGVSNTSLSSAGQRKKRAAPPPPIVRPLPSSISAQGLECIVDSDESLTSDMDISKPSSDIDASASKASSDIVCSTHIRGPIAEQPEDVVAVEPARVGKREPALPIPKPRKVLKSSTASLSASPLAASSPGAIDPSDSNYSRASTSCSPCPSTSASFGLPSLTEDEREEIALAIDMIVEAAKSHAGDDFDSLKSNEEESSLVKEAKIEMPCVALEEDSVPNVTQQNEKTEETETPVSDVVVKAPSLFDDESVTPVNEPEESKLTERREPAYETKLELENASNVDSVKDPPCAVISTIPKCDHIEPFTDDDLGRSLESNDVENSATKKQRKILRSQSEMSHFDFGPAEKHSRHLTTQGEAFTFALNTNLGEAATKCIEASIHAGSGKAPPTDTDILLQKVSDTLSHSLTPPSPPPTPEDASINDVPNIAAGMATVYCPPQGFLNSNDVDTKREELDDQKSRGDHHQSTVVNESSSSSSSSSTNATNNKNSKNNNNINATLGSQQDTSDYVSASGEDLSIGDWEYQIPAPPSAFRDDDREAAVTTDIHREKVQKTKQPIFVEDKIQQNVSQPSEVKKPLVKSKQSLPDSKPQSKSVAETKPIQSSKIDSSIDQVDYVHSKLPPKLITSLAEPSTTVASELSKKAEVLSELEIKINSNKPIVEPVVDRDDELYAPKIAPVENNLSNFTITTYSRQKSLDIFENMDKQPEHSETRVLSTFATLTRGRSIVSDYAEEKVWNGGIKSAQSMERVTMPQVDDRTKFAERNDILREKVSVHRSKSYITLSSNEKFQNRANEIEKKLYDQVNYEIKDKDSSRRFTSLANVNQSTNEEIPRHKEKFSQWRDNILRKQEEPTKEKQLQSLQVLKSILPQLKNAQAAEENSYKNSSDRFTIQKRQEPQRDQSEENVTISSTTSDVQLRANRRSHEPMKRYTYGGPPAVSLGSWSERPCVNVQIKTDTDYKFSSKNNANSTSGPRTVVNLNSASNSNGVEEKSEKTQNSKGIMSQEKKEPAILHTKTISPVEENDESRVDTTSVNFRELSKAFGQDVRLRPKPPMRNPHNRLSEYFERPKADVIAPKQNCYDAPHVTMSSTNVGHNRNLNGPVPPVKRYTSVVGITNNNNSININNNNNNVNHSSNSNVHNDDSKSQQTNFKFVKGLASKAPITTTSSKGFIQKEKYAVPKPPTMPIITGVTLKSVNARPKSGPPTIQADPRDQLLESIRNFGGRQKLRSATERY